MSFGLELWAGLSVQLKPDFRSEPMSRTPCLWMLKLGILKRYKKAGLYQIHFPIKIHSYPFSNNNKVGHGLALIDEIGLNQFCSIALSLVIYHQSSAQVFGSEVRPIFRTVFSLAQLKNLWLKSLTTFNMWLTEKSFTSILSTKYSFLTFCILYVLSISLVLLYA